MAKIMQVVLSQSYYGNQIRNIWTYRADGIPASVSLSFGLLSAFGGIPVAAGAFDNTTVLGILQLIQVPGVQFQSLLVQDIYPTDDFREESYVSTFGANPAAAGTPPIVAFGFRTSRITRAIRRGTKRFVGYPDQAWSPEGGWDVTFEGVLQLLAEAMKDTLEYDDEGNTLSFVPIVCSKEKYVVPDSNPERYAYRYYSDVNTQLANSMSGFEWELYENPRSQNSRQYGRGI